MRKIKQLRKQVDPLDRPLLNLTGSKHPDDHIILRDLFENIFICGSTGTGKTSTVGYQLAKGILNCQNLAPEERIGMIVFLYKSSDAKQWIKWADEAGRSNDVRIISSEGKDSINILEAYRDKEAISAVNTLMVLAGLGMSGSAEQQGEAYWEQMNRQRLHRLLLLTQLSDAPMNITTLYQLHSTAPQTPEQVASEDFRKTSYCWQMIDKAHANKGKENPQFKLIENYFVYEMPNMADRTQSSILSMTGAILEPFVSSTLLNRLFCGETTLSLDDMLDGSIVLLDLPIQQYEYAGKLAQMMFKHILQKRIEERDLSLLPNPICFWIDEYQHFISRYDPLFLSTTRSSRAGSILMTQNISNIYAQIGGNGKIAEEKINALLALTNHKIFLAQNNSITNEFAAKTIGMGIHRLSNTSVQMQQFGASAGISESYQYQVMPHEFTMLKRGGKHHNGIVETIITGTGKTFSNGKNYLRVGFKQPWM
jgi:hypothetical protein